VKRTYTVVLTREPNGTYTVEVPALPGCLTFGETVAEALFMAEDAIQLFVESLTAKGKPIPPDQPHVDLDTTDTPEVLVYKVTLREAAKVA
jgi:predicted RNase H-like HicB family nuclease